MHSRRIQSFQRGHFLRQHRPRVGCHFSGKIIPSSNKSLCGPTILLLLRTLQVISLEGWTDVMYFVQDAHSFWNWLYFVLLIVVRSTISIFYSRRGFFSLLMLSLLLSDRFIFHDQPLPGCNRHPVFRDEASRNCQDESGARQISVLVNAQQFH